MTSNKVKHVLAYLTWFTPSLRNGIRSYAREAGWNLAIPVPVQGIPRLSNQFDGVISLVADQDVFDRDAVFPGAKLVDIRGGGGGLKSDALVINDNRAIGRLAADYFLELGIDRVIGLAFNSEQVSDQRLDSFEQRILECGGTMVRVYSDHGDYTDSYSPDVLMKHAQRAMEELGTPMGVWAVDDFMADLIIQALLELGVEVPGQVKVMGCNNDRAFCENSRVSLSSIDVDLNMLGYESARVLDRLMNGEKVPEVTRIPPLMIDKRASTERNACADPMVMAILGYIQDHFAENITADDIAREVHVSRSVAYKRFSQAIGHPIGREIERIRMENAQSLLIKTDYKIDAVAWLSGYTNTSSFCRRFRQINGWTPGEFRNHGGNREPGAPS